MNRKLVVVVLGNRLNDDGSITEIQEERLKYALEIEEDFKPAYYILSGGLANPQAGRTEAEAMYEYLVNHGINEERLVLEKDSLSTIQNSFYSVPIAKKLGAEALMICTSAYHLGNPGYRAMESFVKDLQGSNIILMTYTK